MDVAPTSQRLAALGFLALISVSCAAGDAVDEAARAIQSQQDLDNVIASEFVDVEDEIRDCMAKLGFDYIPLDVEEIGLVAAIPEDIQDEEFVELYGWGVSTLDFGVLSQPLPDPYEDALAVVSPGERRAWMDALDTDGGCRQQAYFAAEGGLVEETIPILDLAYDYFAVDTRKVAFDEEWSRCMSDEGFQIASPREGEIALREEAAVLQQQMAEEFEEFLQTAEANFEPDTATSPEWTELVDSEKRLARASLACGARPPYLGVPDGLEEIWQDAIASAQQS